MKIDEFLSSLLLLNNFEILLKNILKNYKLFNLIIKMKYSFDINNYNNDIYSDSFSDENVILMFKLLEKKFYKMVRTYTKKILNFKEEFKSNLNGEYYLIICDSELNINIFKVFLIFYYTNVKLVKKNYYIGMDLEFNTKVAALIQLNFDIRSDLHKENLIFIIDPLIFDKGWNSFFIEHILCRSNVYKILHGSDSLDLPYIFKSMLNGEKNLITKFTRSFIDTKFLCEYSYFKNNEQLGKCKIYYILLKENVITEKKFKQLLKNEDKMGPIYDILININNMNENLINYTLYDVVYLYELVSNYIKKLKDFDLVNEIVRLSILNKIESYDVVPKIEIDKINNYLFNFNGKIVKLIDFFNKVFESFLSKNNLTKVLLNINYIKNLLILIFKYEAYFYICKNNVVFSKLKERKLYDKKLLSLKFDYGMLSYYLNEINKFRQYLIKYKD